MDRGAADADKANSRRSAVSRGTNEYGVIVDVGARNILPDEDSPVTEAPHAGVVLADVVTDDVIGARETRFCPQEKS